MITYLKINAEVWQQQQAAVMRLEAQAFSAPQCHPVSFYQEIVADPRQISYLAMADQQVVGFSFAAPLELFADYPGVKQDPYFAQGVVLYGADMVVVSQQRGQGIGKGLKTRQLQDAQALGYQWIAGRNRLKYADAMWAVNQSLGAVEIQRLSGIYQDGREPNACIYYHIRA